MIPVIIKGQQHDLKKSLPILLIFLVCGLLFWVVDEFIHRNEVRAVRDLAPDALCVVELQEGNESVSHTFTTSETTDRFYVRVCPLAGRERLSLTIQRDDSNLYRGAIEGSQRFSLGSGIPAGTFTVALSQLKGRHGAIVVMTDKEPVSTGMTGWQILSRVYLALLGGCAIWVLVSRHSANQYRRVRSARAFQYLFLGFLAMFLYLLFHEGGHALAQIAFGRFDLSRSDFWGIHGSPHSGGGSGPALEPWKQHLITGGAVILPTLVAVALFLFWRQWLRHRNYPVVRLYVTAIVALFVLPYIAAVGCLLGVMNDTHLDAFIALLPGPKWFERTIASGVLLVCVFMLWKVAPEIFRIVKAQSQELRTLRQKQDSAWSDPTSSNLHTNGSPPL